MSDSKKKSNLCGEFRVNPDGTLKEWERKRIRKLKQLYRERRKGGETCSTCNQLNDYTGYQYDYQKDYWRVKHPLYYMHYQRYKRMKNQQGFEGSFNDYLKMHNLTLDDI